MASVLAREAAALRRRCESLPAALCLAPSAQAPWAGAPAGGRGAGEGPAARGLSRALRWRWGPPGMRTRRAPGPQFRPLGFFLPRRALGLLASP